MFVSLNTNYYNCFSIHMCVMAIKSVYTVFGHSVYEVQATEQGAICKNWNYSGISLCIYVYHFKLWK
jgi:hypothetical protein